MKLNVNYIIGEEQMDRDVCDGQSAGPLSPASAALVNQK